VAEKRVSSGTGWIVCGAIVILWGLGGLANSLGMDGPEGAGARFGGFLLVALGIFLLVTGTNKRAVWKKTL
jgi:hypothetical protein